MDSDHATFLTASLKVGGPVTVLGFFVGLMLLSQGKIGVPGLVGITLLGLPVGVVVGFLISHGSGVASKGLVRVITASHGIAPKPALSHAESLVARGMFAEARKALEEYIAQYPKVIEPRLALAWLWRDHLRDSVQAERVLMEAKRLPLSDEQEFAISNALIDFYHATGAQAREQAELARFAKRFAGTDAGERAARALERLRTEG